MDANDALVVIFARNAFYKRMHYLALIAFLLSLIVIGFLLVVLAYLIRNPPGPLYFATDRIGRFIEVVPVDRPNMSIDDVIKWTIHAIQSSSSYNYVTYRSELQSAQKYFTTYGWTNYMKALQESNNLIGLTERRQIVNAVVVGPPKILAQGILGGAYAWRFQMPMLITYQQAPYDSKSTYANPVIINTIVQRQPILQSDNGLGIVQILSTIATQTTTPPSELSPTSSDGTQ